MVSPESSPLACASCPNRNIISRKLAELGILPSSQECPGPETIMHFDIATQSVLGKRDTQIDIDPTHTKTERHCSRDEILIGAGQLLLGRSTVNPNTHFVGHGDDYYLIIMRSAITRHKDDAIINGVEVHYAPPGKYYKSNKPNKIDFKRYVVRQTPRKRRRVL